ncbi:MAG: phage portal protein, partial [Planctomycetota bacterium]
MPMLKRIREWMLGGRDRNGSRPGLRFLRFRTPDSRLQAKYDAAQTTPENRRHWAHADHLSANAAASPEVRRILRSRARYEVANNSYAKGIVLTLANYVVGTGPRLQMLTDDPEANRIIEKEFSRWAKVTGLS